MVPGVGLGLLVVGPRHDEHRRACVPDGRRLLGDTADGTDGPVEVELASDRDLAAAGQLSGRQDVEELEAVRGARRRTDDRARVDGDVERQLDLEARGLQDHAQERATARRGSEGGFHGLRRPVVPGRRAVARRTSRPA